MGSFRRCYISASSNTLLESARCSGGRCSKTRASAFVRRATSLSWSGAGAGAGAGRGARGAPGSYGISATRLARDRDRFAVYAEGLADLPVAPLRLGLNDEQRSSSIAGVSSGAAYAERCC